MVFGSSSHGKLVETKCGQIRSVVSKSRDGRDFYEWRGIPFGKPPVGPLRFASPVPFGKWEGVRDGSKFGNRCPEMGLFNTILGNEDCLYLNVYAPKIDLAKPLSVMVFIHGGGYQNGHGAQYKPHFFMDEDVVFVTPNYRLGPFGFLSTGDGTIRGNMGLKDQALALKWVKDNIDVFGGDSNNITIFGESAGGASIHYLLLSPTTQGLFNKAISQSGVAGQSWGYDSTEDASKYTRRFAQKLGCSSEDSKDIAEHLRSKSIKEILMVYKTELGLIHSPHKDRHHFRPTIEAVKDGEAFLTERPFDLVKEGRAQRVPWMTGVNADEGLLCTISFHNHEENMDVFMENWTVSACRGFGIPEDEPYSADLAQKIKEIYFPGDSAATMTKEQKLKQFTDLYSDAYFNLRMSEAVSMQREFSPVYAYYYSRTGGPSLTAVLEPFLKKRNPLLNITAAVASYLYNRVTGRKPTDFGVCHADELAMLFLLERVFHVKKDDNCMDYKFSKDMVRLWVDFANDEIDMTFRGVKFPAQNATGPLQYLDLTETPRVIAEPFKDRSDALRACNFLELK